MIQRLATILLVASFVSPLTITQVVIADELESENNCYVDLNVPPGTAVTLSNKNYGTKRSFTFDSLVPGKQYETSLILTMPTGQRIEKKLLLRSGWRIPIAVSDRATPELVLQTQHRGIAFCVSRDLKYFFSGISEFRTDMWDIETGKKLREFPEGGPITLVDGNRYVVIRVNSAYVDDIHGAGTAVVFIPDQV